MSKFREKLDKAFGVRTINEAIVSKTPNLEDDQFISTFANRTAINFVNLLKENGKIDDESSMDYFMDLFKSHFDHYMEVYETEKKQVQANTVTRLKPGVELPVP